jgi:hypothetical protein
MSEQPRHYTNALVVHDHYCLNGWPSRKPCNYTGGCYCVRDDGHKGRCRCVCGSTAPAGSAAPTEEDADE